MTQFRNVETDSPLFPPGISAGLVVVWAAKLFEEFNLFWWEGCIFWVFQPGLLESPWESLALGFVVVQSLSHIRLFVTPWTAARQASLSFTISQSLLKLMSIELVMPTDHLILCRPLLLLPSIFPSTRVFSSKSALLLITWPKCWSFSFSISPTKEYSGLIFLGLTGLSSFLSKGPSKVFSSTTIWKH